MDFNVQILTALLSDGDVQEVPILCKAGVVEDDVPHDLRSRRSSSVVYDQEDDDFLTELKTLESWKRLKSLNKVLFRNWYFMHKLKFHKKGRAYYQKHADDIWVVLKTVYRKPFIDQDGEIRWDNTRLIQLAVHLNDQTRLGELRAKMSIQDGQLVGSLVNKKRDKTRKVVMKNITNETLTLRKRINPSLDREIVSLEPNKRVYLKTRLGNVYSWYGDDGKPLQNGEFNIGLDLRTYYYDPKARKAERK